MAGDHPYEKWQDAQLELAKAQGEYTELIKRTARLVDNLERWNVEGRGADMQAALRELTDRSIKNSNCEWPTYQQIEAAMSGYHQCLVKVRLSKDALDKSERDRTGAGPATVRA